jgi:hypothetical protein
VLSWPPKVPEIQPYLVPGTFECEGHIAELYAVSAEDVLFIEWLPAQAAACPRRRCRVTGP